MKISAIIITKNEQDNIEECIKTLSFVNEIIVIDNDSKDKTVELARKLGAKVYTLCGLDFSYLRNLGKEKSTSPWLLYVDADERVSPELAEEIIKVISVEERGEKIKEKINGGYLIPRKNYYLGHEWPKIEKMLRLIRKDALIGWQGMLHETPVVAGEIGCLHSFLLHYTHRDLASMVEKTNEWSEIEARLRYQNRHPKITWWRFFRVMGTAFYDSYIKGKGWKVGVIGLIESFYQAFSLFITYAKLWELQNKQIIQKKVSR